MTLDGFDKSIFLNFMTVFVVVSCYLFHVLFVNALNVDNV